MGPKEVRKWWTERLRSGNYQQGKIKMNPEVKAKWTTALKSGDYRQGTGGLRTHDSGESDEFCCLGVLCDLAVKEKVISTPLLYNDTGYYAYGPDDSTGYLPLPVMVWAGLERRDPLCDNIALSERNDGGEDFSEIADCIEENL